MSINFGTLQGLTIPEGVVTQIADAAGRVLWSAVKPMCTVTIKSMIGARTASSTTAFMDRIYVEIDGQRYQATTLSSAYHIDVVTVVVPYGTVMHCCADSTIAPSMGSSRITLNNATISTNRLAEYDHVITEDIMVELKANGTSYGSTVIIAEMRLSIVSQPAYTVSTEIELSGGYQKGTLYLEKSIAREGDVVAFTATPSTGSAAYGDAVYYGSRLIYTRDGKEQTVYIPSDATSFIMPAADVRLVANFQ